MKKKKSNDVRVIGKCTWCGKLILENQPWQEMEYCRRAGWTDIDGDGLPYKGGIVHSRNCKLAILEMFTKELLNDLKTMEWLLLREYHRDEHKKDIAEKERYKKKAEWYQSRFKTCNEKLKKK